MSLLSYEELLALAARGVIKNVEPDMINSASIDITLGNKILVEDEHYALGHEISLAKKERLRTYEAETRRGYRLKPGQFILAHSQQVFNLPDDISAEYKLKSSMARVGLNHALAGWCDAGWNGSVLTLEIKNWTQNHVIEIKEGDRIGQMIFFKHRIVPPDMSYSVRGRYNGDNTVKGIKQ